MTNLLLNIPGACFLCLQADDDKSDARGEGGPTPTEDLNGGIFNLSRICRYLNINQCSLLLTSLKYGDAGGAEDVGKQLCSFSVKVCPKCLELTEKLNETISQFEKAKLMVNHHLHSFHNILEGKKKEEKINADSDKSLEAKLVLLLREEVKDKSLKILRKAEAAMPQVILPKCQILSPDASKTSYSPPLSPESPPIIPSTITSIKTQVSHLVASNLLPIPNNSGNSRLYRCPFCLKILGASKFPLHLSSLHSDKLLSSHFPPSSPPSESICREVLHTKVVRNSEKLPSSSSSSVRRLGCHICGLSYSNGNILKHHFLITHTDTLCEEINNFTKSPQPTGNPIKVCTITTKTKRTCSPPPPPPKSVNHLINTEDMVEKLIDPKFQEKKISKITRRNIKPIKMLNEKLPPISKLGASPNPVQKLIKSYLQSGPIDDPSSSSFHDKPTANNTKFHKKYQCPFCHKSPFYSKFARHIANLHPDKLLVASTTTSPAIDKLQNDNPIYFKQLCKKLLASQVQKITKKGFKDNLQLSCHLCPRKYSEGRHLKHHFVVKHSDYLIEQLIKIRQDQGGEDKQMRKMVIKKEKSLNDKPLKTRGRPSKDKHSLAKPPSKYNHLKVKLLKKKKSKALQPPRSEEDKTCTICRQIFSQYDKLQRHVVTWHPDQLFLGCKPDGMDDKQFGVFCKDFFKKEIGQGTYGKPSEKIYRCGYCPNWNTSYKGYQYLVVHLAYQHPREMEERLIRLGDQTFCGGGGGDVVVMEEDASEFDMKPDVGPMDGMLYPTMILDEFDDKQDEGGYQEMVGDNEDLMMRNMTEEQLEVPENQTVQQIIKMEVNEAFNPDEY